MSDDPMIGSDWRSPHDHRCLRNLLLMIAAGLALPSRCNIRKAISIQSVVAIEQPAMIVPALANSGQTLAPTR